MLFCYNYNMLQKNDNIRSKKIAHSFKQAIGQILNEELLMPDSTMISVGLVKVNPAMTFVDIYVSAYGDSSIEKVLVFLTENMPYIRILCAKQISHLKYMPSFRFHKDNSVEGLLRLSFD